jgi:hypothetical protein
MQNKDQRRFPRVQVQTPFGDVFRFLGGRVFWPNNEVSEVLDLSYKGLAARRPGVFKILDKAVVKLLVELGDETPYECTGRVVWSNKEWVGVEINTLPPVAHISLRKFLDDSLLGQGLRRVDAAHFASGNTFDYWFQGGAACHLFIWLNAQKIVEKVQFDIDGDKLELHRGVKVKNSDVNSTRALRVLSQLKIIELPLESFMHSVSP